MALELHKPALDERESQTESTLYGARPSLLLLWFGSNADPGTLRPVREHEVFQLPSYAPIFREARRSRKLSICLSRDSME